MGKIGHQSISCYPRLPPLLLGRVRSPAPLQPETSPVTLGSRNKEKVETQLYRHAYNETIGCKYTMRVGTKGHNMQKIDKKRQPTEEEK